MTLALSPKAHEDLETSFLVQSLCQGLEAWLPQWLYIQLKQGDDNTYHKEAEKWFCLLEF